MLILATPSVRTFDGSGGAIHCVTKQIPADNPVRILHPSITGDGNAYASTNATIRAEVTNRSGISEVLCVYRVNGGTWQQLALINTGNGNEFAGTMPTSTFTIPSGSYTTVEYYITATSVNGKTITKPMTANQGGYYTFYLGTNMPLAIDEVEEDMFGQFFPNPATNRASVRINMGNGMQYKVQIIDMMGRVAHTATLDAAGDILYNIDTQKLGNGIYNVVFTANDGTRVVRRIVVK